jgi:hypothetical protein
MCLQYILIRYIVLPHLSFPIIFSFLMTFSHLHIMYFNPIHPHHCLLSSSLLLAYSPSFPPIDPSTFMCFYFLNLDSTYKRCAICLSDSISFNISTSIHSSANHRISFFVTEQYSSVCINHIFFIQSSADGHLHCNIEELMIKSVYLKSILWYQII